VVGWAGRRAISPKARQQLSRKRGPAPEGERRKKSLPEPGQAGALAFVAGLPAAALAEAGGAPQGAPRPPYSGRGSATRCALWRSVPSALG
jgi:hypothetical protein